MYERCTEVAIVPDGNLSDVEDNEVQDGIGTDDDSSDSEEAKPIESRDTLHEDNSNSNDFFTDVYRWRKSSINAFEKCERSRRLF